MPPVHAKDSPAKPLLELGIAGFSATIPDYPAAEQNHLHHLIIPYIVYRGQYIRSDEKGLLRGLFVDNHYVEVDISLMGAFPVTSDENRARRGMPDLDWLGEIGPRLLFHAYRDDNDTIDLDLPLRAVISTDLSRADYQGLVTEPGLYFRRENREEEDSYMQAHLSSIFAASRLMDYFYTVPPRYAAVNRPIYHADPGYLGSTLILSASKPITPQWRIVGYAGGSSVHGAANEESPLYKDSLNAGIGVGVIWKFYQSQERSVVR